MTRATNATTEQLRSLVESEARKVGMLAPTERLHTVTDKSGFRAVVDGPYGTRAFEPADGSGYLGKTRREAETALSYILTTFRAIRRTQTGNAR